MREKKSNFFVKDYVSSLLYARVNQMPIQMVAFPNYYAIVLAIDKFETYVVKVGSTCENRTDLNEKRIFYYKLSKQLLEACGNISILRIPLYDSNSCARIWCLCLCPFKKFYPQKQLHMV